MLARGKMKVQEIRSTTFADEVLLRCEYDENDPEETRFSAATPTGELKVSISNPNIRGKIQPGQTYYVDLTLVE